MPYTGTVPSGTLAVGSGLPAAWTQQVGLSLAALESAWTAYTPTFSGWTITGGTTSGRYIQVGKLVIFEAQYSLTAAPTVLTTAPTLTLPVTAAASAPSVSNIRAQFTHTGTGSNLAVGFLASTTTVQAYIIGTSGLFTNPTTTTPFTWANTDVIFMSGCYQSA